VLYLKKSVSNNGSNISKDKTKTITLLVVKSDNFLPTYDSAGIYISSSLICP